MPHKKIPVAFGRIEKEKANRVVFEIRNQTYSEGFVQLSASKVVRFYDPKCVFTTQ